METFYLISKIGSYSSEVSHSSPSCHPKQVVCLFVIKGVGRQCELDSKGLERECQEALTFLFVACIYCVTLDKSLHLCHILLLDYKSLLGECLSQFAFVSGKGSFRYYCKKIIEIRIKGVFFWNSSLRWGQGFLFKLDLVPTHLQKSSFTVLPSKQRNPSNMKFAIYSTK